MQVAPQPAWKRILVVAMLTWAMLDLLVPGLCAGEATPIAGDGGACGLAAELAACSADEAGLQVTAASRSSDGDSGITGEDDCWCCCSHISPSKDFQQAALPVVAGHDLTPTGALHQGWFSLLPHPPRN
jgi:hypothetical protein